MRFSFDICFKQEKYIRIPFSYRKTVVSLIKEALKRKLNSQKIAKDLENQLEDLASMTENLLKNALNKQ